MIGLEAQTLLERFHQLTEHRQSHIMRVIGVMEELADRHGLDPELARWAGFGHDLAREFSRPCLLAESRRLNLDGDEFMTSEPILWHGPIAAKWLQNQNIGDPSVWQAIRYHTTAGPGLGPMAKALFIADAVEPGRSFPAREGLQALALKDLESGYRAVLEATVSYTQQRGLVLHPDTVKALRESDHRG